MINLLNILRIISPPCAEIIHRTALVNCKEMNRLVIANLQATEYAFVPLVQLIPIITSCGSSKYVYFINAFFDFIESSKEQR